MIVGFLGICRKKNMQIFQVYMDFKSTLRTHGRKSIKQLLNVFKSSWTPNMWKLGEHISEVSPITLFLKSFPGHVLLNGQDHEIVHLGQSLSCLSTVNYLNLLKESCHLEDEQTKAGKGAHLQWFGVSHWYVSEIDLTHLKCCLCTRSLFTVQRKGKVRCWVIPLFKRVGA